MKTSENDFIQPLRSWINRLHPLPKRFYKKSFHDKPKENWSTWLTIEETSLLHLSNKLNWTSLSESIEKTNLYLHEAGEIINGLEGAWLDREERQWILDRI